MALYKFASGLRNALTVSRNVGQRKFATLKDSKDRLRDLEVPEKPKKPLTPYFRFLKVVRQDIISKNPEVKATEVVKQAAADWAKAHATIKDKYVNEYKQDMEEYSAKMSVYTTKLTPEQQESIKEVRKLSVEHKKKLALKRKYKLLDKPKRPLGPYMQFLVEQSKTVKGSLALLMQQLKGQYASLTDVEKQKYVQRFEDDKKRYQLEMKEWESKMIAEGHEDVVRQSVLQARPKPSRFTAGAKPKKQ